jgi:hypothetical protein
MKGDEADAVRTSGLNRAVGCTVSTRNPGSIGLQQPGKVDAALLELTCLRAPLEQPYPEDGVK